jgi:serralysin
MAIVYGSKFSESINALDGVTNGADTIYGYGGNDTILGLGGNDLIIVGAGEDDINGGEGIDTAIYTDSSQAVTVSLVTGTGAGGTAEGDTLESIENLYGSAYNDILIGNSGANTLSGNGGNDILKGGGGADVLSGGSGDDLLLGGAGGDALYGGSGSDTVSYAGSSQGVQVYLSNQHAINGDAEGDTLNSIENATGSSHADVLQGDNGVNVLSGGDGDDHLDGRGGADTMIGGDGNDTYRVVDSDDVIIEEIGGGEHDWVAIEVSYSLDAGVEVEKLYISNDETTQDINLTGNEFDQTIAGNFGDNVLSGRDGNDTLVGYAGADTFLFNYVLNAATNVDTISDFDPAYDLIALDDGMFNGLATEVGHYLMGTEFVIGAAAQDADDRIIYNSATGALLYDSDGTGAAAAIQFATVGIGLNLANDDFIVV